MPGRAAADYIRAWAERPAIVTTHWIGTHGEAKGGDSMGRPPRPPRATPFDEELMAGDSMGRSGGKGPRGPRGS